MKTPIISTTLVAAGLVMVSASFNRAQAQQVQCSSEVGKTTAVTNAAGHVITTRYQTDRPNLQPLLATTIESEGGCLVAHLSGQVRITDNYVAFQVRVNGIPLRGQHPLPLFSTPVVFVAIDSAPVSEDEQFIDPSKAVSYNFFTKIPPGRHLVEVLGAAGSGIDPANPPTATHLVLTLEYR